MGPCRRWCRRSGIRNGRLQTLRAELADIVRPRVVPLNVAQLKARVLEKAEEWRALLRKHAPIAHQMMRKLVEGRIEFTPDREAGIYRFRAAGTMGNFFSGILQPFGMASPICASWNQLDRSLRQVEGLRRMA